jgi:hypothetical protein
VARAQVPCERVPSSTPVGHLINDAACLAESTVVDHLAAFNGLQSLEHLVVHQYEVSQALPSRWWKRLRFLFCLLTLSL